VVRTAVSALEWNWMEGRRPSLEAPTPGKEILGLVALSLASSLASAAPDDGRLKTGLVSRGDVGVCRDGDAVGDGVCDISLTGSLDR